MTKVFGIGWAKTGTTTLGQCFRLLGFDHQGQRLDLVKHLGEKNPAPIMDIVRHKESFEDWPWLLLYRELDEHFPASKFVLTVRDEEKWLLSYRNMLDRQKEATPEMNSIRRILYGLPFPDITSEQLIDRYRQHNRDVRDYFSQRPNDLLVVNWEEGDGWKELCGFLKQNIPHTLLPHANRGDYAQRNPIKQWLIRLGLTK
jgi:hypothetical protein